MDIINIGIYDEHKLTRESLGLIVQNNRDFNVLFQTGHIKDLFECLNRLNVNILLIHAHIVNKTLLEILVKINNNYRRIKALVLSACDDEADVFRIVKSGANGFLAKECGLFQLTEAIYTLRNGHDYYSESITQILLKQYISKIKQNKSDIEITTRNLSVREIEIIELWGNSFTNKEIADKLFISVRTVESHKNHIMQKLNLRTSVDLVKFAIKNNIIEIN